MLEILISIFVLSIGLVGIAILIPAGKLQMIAVNKSDRGGACGRAAMREVKARRMLGWTPWVPAGVTPTNVFVIDPLYYSMNTLDDSTTATAFNTTYALGGVLSRMTFSNPGWIIPSGAPPNTVAMKKALADSVFRWQDELTFDTGAIPTSIGRPRGYVQDSSSPPLVGPYPQLPSEPKFVGAVTPYLMNNGSPMNDGNFSWFLTVAPQPGASTGTYSVSAVVCYKRDFTPPGGTAPPGEVTMIGTGAGGPLQILSGTTSYGGASISISQKWPANWSLRDNDWILLTSWVTATGVINQATWYRVVGAGYDQTSNTTNVSLVGPDWNGGDNSIAANTFTAVAISGAGGGGAVTGVYTTTVQLDNDGIWTQ